MGISKCSYCGRERSLSELKDGEVSHGICPECSMKEFDFSDKDVEDDARAEVGGGYGDWQGEWPFAKDRPDIVKRVSEIQGRLNSEGAGGEKRK